ncbi:hypothetical protein J6590_070712 [Homalodisca vitripennis]|nr:hypothetical protein J6590_070712 [Homalodisca vitripennis]
MTHLNLTTNTLKSNVLNFALRDVGNHCGSAVLLADSTLEEVLSSKFLGIHLDRGLTWNEHITSSLRKNLLRLLRS